MSTFRLALANLPFPATREESVEAAERAIADACREQAEIVCFPECFVPGYRRPGKAAAPPDAVFLERAWRQVAAAAGRAGVAVVLGTERVTEGGVRIAALVVNGDGTIAGFQDKVQLDPSEEATFTAGIERRVFQAGALRFGIAICHEGWRYPETVRWAARRGAQVVFHPHYHWPEPGAYRPVSFGESSNSFFEAALVCRAAENTCFFASVNYAEEGSQTTATVVRPDGTVQCRQPYGKPGLLIADVELAEATGLLARRWKPDAREESA